MPARCVVHAAVLALVNLVGVYLGFVAFAMVDSTNQLAVQFPVAIAVSLAGFALWAKLAGPRQSRRPKRDVPEGPGDPDPAVDPVPVDDE